MQNAIDRTFISGGGGGGSESYTAGSGISFDTPRNRDNAIVVYEIPIWETDYVRLFSRKQHQISQPGEKVIIK